VSRTIIKAGSAALDIIISLLEPIPPKALPASSPPKAIKNLGRAIR